MRTAPMGASGLDEKYRLLKEQKVSIEGLLKEVMSRTERGRYIDDDQKGVEAKLSRDQFPSKDEMVHYFQLRKHLIRDQKTARHHSSSLLGYWKTAPSPLSFMEGYKLGGEDGGLHPQHIQASHTGEGKSCLSRLYQKNLQFRELFKELLALKTKPVLDR
ncbi:MAG: hypothetical protein R3C03_23385 [Pirellulaceae bacterium]